MSISVLPVVHKYQKRLVQTKLQYDKKIKLECLGKSMKEELCCMICITTLVCETKEDGVGWGGESKLFSNVGQVIIGRLLISSSQLP